MSTVKRTWKLNGKPVTVRFPAGRRLLDVLREDLGLIGSKESCGEGECGACTVIVDDEPMVACILPAGQLPNGTDILTIEGIEKKRAGRLLQQAPSSAVSASPAWSSPAMPCCAGTRARRPGPSARRLPATCAAAPATPRSSRR